MSNLQGKNVVVTGASSGFGKAIALAFADQGANLALIARREDKLNELAALIQAKGLKAVVCPTDVASEEEINKALQTIKTDLGHVDILVNNAGTNINARRISETTLEEWQHLMNVNVTSAFLFTKALLPNMIKQEQGSIINIASK